MKQRHRFGKTGLQRASPANTSGTPVIRDQRALPGQKTPVWENRPPESIALPTPLELRSSVISEPFLGKRHRFGKTGLQRAPPAQTPLEIRSSLTGGAFRGKTKAPVWGNRPPESTACSNTSGDPVIPDRRVPPNRARGRSGGYPSSTTGPHRRGAISSNRSHSLRSRSRPASGESPNVRWASFWGV